MFQWLRHYIRQRTLPIKPEVAWKWKTKLSIIYAFIGWQLLGAAMYTILKQNTPDNPTSSDYAKLLGVTEAHVIKITGTKKTDEYDLKLNDEDFDEYYKHMEEKIEKAQNSVVPSTGYWNRRGVDAERAKKRIES
ncbi:uncharacterized protein LOC100233151 [Nasonia vitripennis]|uniref:Uncharacterized protein n=1 Tax=Nasonia vitripennis TaxID=7425 RepID=A0A7M6URD0_NASVI|nr:uncharacterized protein LOC100233151 [Nasonia vitripennis]